jgi:release factor glutamine methyltransferase
MITLLEIIRRSETFLANHGIERPRHLAEEIIADALGMKRLDLYLQFDRPLTEEELASLRRVVMRGAQQEPLAYIAGCVDFAGVKLKVDRSVLIPRPETEILVETVVLTLQALPLEGKVLWDMCCGSGCIGIALKARFPLLKVVLSDVSEAALETARLNAQGADITFKQGDLFAPFVEEMCDFFVCNPPYISECEFAHLPATVRKWEPSQALLAGPTGLEYYEQIACCLRSYLNLQGLAWLEIGRGQGTSVANIFNSQGWHCQITPDWAEHDRFAFITHLTQKSLNGEKK